MEERAASVSVLSRLLVATALAVSVVALAGCTTAEDYSTSVGEPTNGTFIEDVSFSEINEMDGARYELEYRYNGSDDGNYTVNVYERKNGSYESAVTDSSRLVPGAESTHGGSLAPPWDPGEERTYRLEVARADTDVVVDSVTVTIERDGG